MKPLVSIILPTFKRPYRLYDCMRTIVQSCDNPDRVEFCLRFQWNDPLVLPEIENARAIHSKLKVLVSDPYDGYKSNHIHFQETYLLATGTWTWLMNDDCTVHGKGWDTRLSEIQDNRFLVPAIHKLGTSVYQNDPDCGAIIAPLYAIRDIMPLQGPPDRYIRQTLRKRDFFYQFLDVTFHHHRESDEERAKHYGSVEAATFQ